MGPGFGFSVGDFIAAIGLIAKVSKAVKEKSSASNEYQQILLELEALDRTLRHLQALRPKESNVDHVNAIRGMALTCRIPLQEFLEKIQKYEASLGPFAMRNIGSLRSAGRKSQWAIFMSEEVAKLRVAIGAKVLSINLLLATHASEALGRIEEDANKSHLALMAKILEQRKSIQKLDKKIDQTQCVMEDNFQRQSKKTEEISNHIDSAAETLRHVASTTEAVNTTVMSFRALAVQLMRTINHLPSQVRETLEQVVRSNVQMYTMLRAIDSNISRAPALQPQDSVRFEDVLGRTKFLPYEYFRHVEVFNSFLQTQFEGVPGEQKVLQRQYLILNARSNGEPIKEEEWATTVFPGASLVMSALVEHLRLQEFADRCPRADCDGLGVFKNQPTFRTCEKCGMDFNVERAPPTAPTKMVSNRRLEPPRSAAGSASRWQKATQNNHDPREQSRERISHEDVEEVEFWEDSSNLIDQMNRDLSVFRRVHLQPPSAVLQTMNSVDKSHYQIYDVTHVREKFPMAPEYLVERLGRAISRRRQYITYRKLLETEGYFTHQGAKVGGWECPVCIRPIAATHSQSQWIKHIHGDLHSYMCTVKSCETGDRMYRTRREWFEHEIEMHYPDLDGHAVIDCPLRCQILYQGNDTFKSHMENHLEQIALFALPRLAQNPLDEDYFKHADLDTGSGGSSHESVATIQAKLSDMPVRPRKTVAQKPYEYFPEGIDFLSRDVKDSKHTDDREDAISIGTSATMLDWETITGPLTLDDPPWGWEQWARDSLN